ncbi:5'-methylthioadenosine/adenosylhomocysteine nucleosidase [Acetoanaerobium noterae]|uniref:5'-methylthioadenosine/adenosylhomocysteine nucleosidase n=1 Tax=Acetoanaerobium noterae TaxID=745369 RepID=UPI0028AA9537|nr:5'-methylthioadenosine/adenosylhomocysteine nucleosidase [Acetoanaerobium noterae]
MNKIGIIGAMEEEITLVKELMNDIRVSEVAELTFYMGRINDTDLVVVRSGIGKVNAAMCTQILIDRFEVKAIINIGVAGAIADDLEIGDIVLSTKLIEHDFDVTAFGHKKGVIPRMDSSIFIADDKLIDMASVAAKDLKDVYVKKGIVVSGDVFVSSSELKDALQAEFNADCAEMEGAAIAHVCMLNKMPFLVIRAMSDKANGEAPSNFDEFVFESAKNSKKLILNMLTK